MEGDWTKVIETSEYLYETPPYPETISAQQAWEETFFRTAKKEKIATYLSQKYDALKNIEWLTIFN